MTIVMDPHDGHSLGLPVPKVKADIVLISHAHEDHVSGMSLATKPIATVIDEPGDYEIEGVTVRGVKAFHDDVRGSRLGTNIVYVFEFEGVRFSHLGDLGHVLSPEQVEEIGSVDVLMVGVGGKQALADENIRGLKPRVVIPMHYWIEGIIFPYFPLADVEVFLRGKMNVRRINESQTEYRKENLPKRMMIDVFTL